MVRFQKLAVSCCWKDKKYFCRTSHYASARAGVDPNFFGVDSNYCSSDLGSTQLSLGSTQLSLGSTPATLGSALSGNTEPYISAGFHLGRLNTFGDQFKVQWGRLKFHLGRPSQGFQRDSIERHSLGVDSCSVGVDSIEVDSSIPGVDSIWGRPKEGWGRPSQ